MSNIETLLLFVFAVSVSFESRPIVKTFIAYSTLICTVVTMFPLVLLELFFQVSSKITSIALKYVAVVFLNMYCELPLAHEPLATIFDHTLEGQVFSMNDLVSL